MNELEIAQLAQTSPFLAQQLLRRQQESRALAGQQLYQQYPLQPPPQIAPGPAVPPPPGTPAGGPQAPMPGTNLAPPPQGAPQAPGAPPPPGPAAAPGGAPGFRPIAPFRPMPTGAPQTAAPAGPGEIQPPPAAAAPAAPSPEQPKPFNLPQMIQSLQRSGIPAEKVMDMLDTLAPTMNAQNKAELDYFKAQATALKTANEAYAREINAWANMRRAQTGEQAETRRTEQGQQRLDIMRQRAAQAAGGSGNLKSTEVIYPKDASGKVDQTKPPIGTRSVTKSGKIIYMDPDGIVTTAGALGQGGTAKEGKAAGGGAGAVRQSLVKSGVANSLSRLDEIEKKFPAMNTSAFFGTHGEGPVSRTAYGMGRGTLSSSQKQADAMWASFIDEAIPVFTGGLRGSDAFRRFLIEQAPGPGDDAASRKEKMRLLRANIEGTSKAFFNTFASNPAMWPPGVTKEQVEQAKGGGAAGGEQVQEFATEQEAEAAGLMPGTRVKIGGVSGTWQ